MARFVKSLARDVDADYTRGKSSGASAFPLAREPRAAVDAGGEAH
jgi:hypothetical protein